MRKKGIKQLLAMALVCGLGINTLINVNVSTVFAASSYAGGSGTAVDPYLITTPEELNQFRLDASTGLTNNKYYKLGNDIDLSTFDTDSDASNGNWVPIGGTNFFKGVLDGDDHSINNLKINTPSVSGVAFINQIDVTGSVKNIKFNNADITGSYYVGIVAGINNGNIMNTNVQGKVAGTATFGYIGGVVGQNKGIIANINADVEVANAYKYSGIITGGNWSKGAIINVFANGSVTSSYGYSGGITGENTGAINNVISVAKVNSTTYSGAITGGDIGYITNSYWNKETSGQNNYYPSESITGQLSGIYGLTTSEIQGENAKTNMGLLNFDNTWTTTEDGYPIVTGKYSLTKDTGWELYSSGTGTENDPYVITNPKQLYCLAIQVNDNLFDTTNKYYSLGNDIDFVNYDVDNNELNGNWVPIGTSTNPFKGVFDGNNFVIKNLSVIDTASKYASVGFFGYIKNATVKNVGIKNGKLFGGRFGSSTSTYNIGGIVGYVGDATSKDSIYNFIQNCFYDGDIEVQTNNTISVGGIVGYGASLRIDNSYAKGDILISFTGTSTNLNTVRAAGIIAYANGTNTNATEIANYGGVLINKVYSAMNITPYLKGVASPTGTYSGQIIGLSNYTTKLQDAYWDIDVYNNPLSVGKVTTLSNATLSFVDTYALSTSQMQGENAKANMRLLDFTNTWKTVANDYPTFKTNAVTEVPSVKPTVSKLEDGKIELVDNNPELYKADLYYRINANPLVKANDWTLYTTPFEPVYDENGKFNLEVKSVNKLGLESEIVSILETKTDDEVTGEVPTTPTPTPEPTPNLSVDKDLTVNVIAENSLEMSLSTNEISFLNYSGTQDFENSDLTITISSGIAYDLNATLKKVLTDKLDETNKMEASLLGIKLLSDAEYQFFAQEGDSKTLISNAPSGNAISHGVGIKLKGDSSVKPGAYQGLINFVAIQK